MLAGFPTEIWVLAGGLVTQAVGIIIWATRVEAKVNFNERYQNQLDQTVKALRESHDTLEPRFMQEMTKLRESMSRQGEALARIEGFLKGKDHEH